MACKITAEHPRDEVVTAWLAGEEFCDSFSARFDDPDGNVPDFLYAGDVADDHDDPVLSKPRSQMGPFSRRRPFRLIFAGSEARWLRKQTRPQALNTGINRRRQALAITETHEALCEAQGKAVRTKPRLRRTGRRQRIAALYDQGQRENLLVADAWKCTERVHEFRFPDGTTLHACDDTTKLRRLFELAGALSQPGKNRHLMRFATSQWNIIAFEGGRDRMIRWRHADGDLRPGDAVTLSAWLSERT